jgi:hypothetical protein
MLDIIKKVFFKINLFDMNYTIKTDSQARLVDVGMVVFFLDFVTHC